MISFVFPSFLIINKFCKLYCFCILSCCSCLEITHEATQVKGNSLIIKGVTMIGNVPSHTGKVSRKNLAAGGIAHQCKDISE